MNIRLATLLAATLIAFRSAAGGELLSFPDKNYSIEMPAGWAQVKVSEPPPHCMIKSSDGKRVAQVIVYDPPSGDTGERDQATIVGELLNGVKKGARKYGHEVRTEGAVSANGLNFLTLEMGRDGAGSMAARLTATGKTVYLVQVLHSQGEVSQDAELRAVLESFRVLKIVDPAPLSRPEVSARPSSPLFRASYQIGYYSGYFILAAVGVALLVRALRSRKT